MEFFGLIAVFIAVIIIILLFTVLKNMLKVVFAFISILTLVLGVGSFFIYMDAIDLKENFQSSPKLFVLQNNNEYLTAFEVVDITNKSSVKNIDKNSIDTNDIRYYKTLIFDFIAFDTSLSNNLIIGEGENQITLTKENVEGIFESDNPLDYFVEKVYNTSDNMELIKESIRTQLHLENDSEVKNFVFQLMIADLFQDDGTGSVIELIRSNDLTVLPKTPIFYTIEKMPQFIVNMVKKSIPELGVN